jgi:hypothetical protein
MPSREAFSKTLGLRVDAGGGMVNGERKLVNSLGASKALSTTSSVLPPHQIVLNAGEMLNESKYLQAPFKHLGPIRQVLFTIHLSCFSTTIVPRGT